MVALPGRVGGRQLPAPSDAPSVSSEGKTPTETGGGPSSSRKAPSVPGECHKHGLSGCAFCVPPVRAATRNATVAEVAAARADLEGALEFAREVGATVPCLGPQGAFWTSDDVDEQAAAALGCGDCPLPVQCAAYARLTHASAGVWGGRIHGGSARSSRDVKGPRSTVKPKATKKRPKDGDLSCRCGCLGRTRGGWYRPGHDSLHLARLIDSVRGGRLRLLAATEALAHSPRLRAKLLHRLGVVVRRG